MNPCFWFNNLFEVILAFIYSYCDVCDQQFLWKEISQRLCNIKVHILLIGDFIQVFSSLDRKSKRVSIVGMKIFAPLLMDLILLKSNYVEKLISRGEATR